MADSKLRVLPLGGLGEIGKNMTVFEYEDRIVVVDVGLRFPTAEMVGIDLVLPDFAYLRDRVDDIEGIVVTHGHEDHLGSLPWVLRELAVDIPVFGGPLTTAMARSKLDEHRLQGGRRQRRQGRRPLRARALRRRARAHDALDPRRGRRDPDHRRWARSSSPATTSSTRRRSTASRPTSGGWPRSASEDLLLLCGDSTNADRPGFSPSEAIVGPKLQEIFLSCEGRIVVTSFASNIHRVQQVVDAAAAHGRKVVAGRALDAQERQHRALAGPHRRARGHPRAAARARGLARREARDHLDRVPGRAAERAAAHGPPRPPAGRAAPGRHRAVQRHADPRQRARGQRDDRPPLPHRLRRDHDARGADPRLRARLPGGAQADAQPDPAALRDALPRRPQAHPPARRAWPRRWASTPTTSSRARTACRWSSTAGARASARPSARG